MKWKVCASSAVMVLALIGLSLFAKQHVVSFKRLQEAKTRLAELGYHCTTDSANGKLGCGFMISRQEISWSEVGTICKAGPMGPRWQGKVWVTLNPQFWQLEGIPDQAGVRVWGSVLAFGDEEFLNEIEESL